MASDRLRLLLEEHRELTRQRVAITDKMFDVEGRITALQDEEPTPMNYQAYLGSQAWKWRAQEAKRRSGYRCQLCNAGGTRLHVHHRTYERIGHEDPEDLICLCEACHKRFHGKAAETAA